VFDLAIGPENSRRLVASTDRGMFASADAGARWRPLRDGLAGLLAWPAADRLFLVDGQGLVSRSDDAGRTFEVVGSIGGPPRVHQPRRDEKLYAALGDGNVVSSGDGGATWEVRATP